MAQAAKAQAEEKRHVVSEVPHCKTYSDGTIFFGPVRASYPHVFTPYKGDDDKIRFGIVGLFPKGLEYRDAKDALKDYITDMVRTDLKMKDIPADKKFLRDGDLAGKEEYKGMFSISAGDSKRRPTTLDNRRDPKTGKARVLVRGEDDDRIYPGCWVNILIRPWSQNHKKWGKRINANLIVVQFVSDDEPFGTGVISQEDIEETFDDYIEESGFDDGLGDDDEL